MLSRPAPWRWFGLRRVERGHARGKIVITVA
jgi:hypothetical protein